MVSIYSVFSAIVFYNIGLIAVYILMRRTSFVIHYTAASLSLLTLLATLRLFIPADLPGAFIIRSTRIIPAVQNFALSEIPSSNVTAGALLAIVWGTGTFCYIVYDLYLFFVVKRAESRFTYVGNEKILDLARELGIKCRIKISPDIREPYSAGIFKPAIFLPDWDLNDQELKAVLSHEYQHIRSLDAFKKLVFLLLEALFWWNPISHIFRRELNQLLEIQCDYKMTAGKSENSKLQYAETLLSVMKRLTGPKRDCLCASSLTNSAKNMKQRFELILENRASKVKRTKIVLYIVMISVFVLSFFVIAQPYYEPPITDMDGICLVDDGIAYVLEEDGEYVLYYGEDIIDTFAKEEFSADHVYSETELPIIEN